MANALTAVNCCCDGGIPDSVRRRLTSNPYKWAAKSDSEYTKHFADRDGWQHNRIRKGINSGELSEREKGVLLHRQERLQSLFNGFMEDGDLSYKEKLKLERARNNASLQIYRLKHNDEEA